MENQAKTVFVTVSGVPNVGKSTLVNRLVGSRIAITSYKPQTTRGRMLGVYTVDNIQYVFFDTPGFHLPQNRLDEHMVKTVRESMADIDAILYVVFPKKGLDAVEQQLFDEIKASGTPIIPVLNKCDTITVKRRDELSDSLEQTLGIRPVPVSALTGEGSDVLLEKIAEYAQPSPFLYDEDAITDTTLREIAAEIIREKLLVHLSDELPHGCAVQIERFDESNPNRYKIEALIVCEKQSHKGMIIGKDGAMLKKITNDARHDIEEAVETHVNLKCWVKVTENWRNKESFIKDLGL